MFFLFMIVAFCAYPSYAVKIEFTEKQYKEYEALNKKFWEPFPHARNGEISWEPYIHTFEKSNHTVKLVGTFHTLGVPPTTVSPKNLFEGIETAIFESPILYNHIFDSQELSKKTLPPYDLGTQSIHSAFFKCLFPGEKSLPEQLVKKMLEQKGIWYGMDFNLQAEAAFLKNEIKFLKEAPVEETPLSPEEKEKLHSMMKETISYPYEGNISLLKEGDHHNTLINNDDYKGLLLDVEQKNIEFLKKLTIENNTLIAVGIFHLPAFTEHFKKQGYVKKS